MSKLENIDAPDILGITDQQFNLLKTVYKLSSKNKQATPREIELSYGKDFGGEIQKSNLFRQLKILLDKDFLTREGEANYKLDIDGLKKTLEQRKQEYAEKLQHYQQLSDEIEEYFKKATERPEQPVVEYIAGDKELFLRISQSLKKAHTLYITAKFPAVAYTYSPYMHIGRGEYMQMLLHRCFEVKDLNLFYLTPLDLDYPYGHSLKLYNDSEKALHECETILDNLENITQTYSNLHVFYLKNPYGLDVTIPEGKELSESYSFLRDEKMNAIGGIYIRSSETAHQTKHTFLELCRHAQELRNGKEQDICDELRAQLKKFKIHK